MKLPVILIIDDTDLKSRYDLDSHISGFLLIIQPKIKVFTCKSYDGSIYVDEFSALHGVKFYKYIIIISFQLSFRSGCAALLLYVLCAMYVKNWFRKKFSKIIMFPG